MYVHWDYCDYWIGIVEQELSLLLFESIWIWDKTESEGITFIIQSKNGFIRSIDNRIDIILYILCVEPSHLKQRESKKNIVCAIDEMSMNRIQFYYYLTDLYYTNFVSNKLKPVDYISNSTLLQYILHDVCTY